jgi:ribosomal-protein-serine acetyltransferase
MFPLALGDNIELRLLDESSVAPMYVMIMANRAHLDPWLRWSARIQTPTDLRAYIDMYAAKYAANDGFHAGIWFHDMLVGGMAVRYLNHDSHKTEIGYWLGAQFTGKGLVTRACRAVINHLIMNEKMHRIEIQCVVDNMPSRAVAERLGFTMEGIMRDSEWVSTAYRDHCMYSLLAHEWQG